MWMSRPRNITWILVMSLATISAIAGLAAYFGSSTPVASPSPFPPGIFAAHVVAFSGVSLLLVAVGVRRDRRALPLATVFMLVAASFAGSLLGGLKNWGGGFPTLANVLVYASPDPFLAYFFWQFVREFPRGFHSGGMAQAFRFATFASALVGCALFLANVLQIGELQRRLGPLEEWLRVFSSSSPTFLYWAILFVFFLSALPFMVVKAQRALPDERHRAGLFVAGVLLGFGPIMIQVVLLGVLPSYREFIMIPDNLFVSGLVLYPFLLSVPFTTAYAVMVERALDVSLVIRQVIQYTLARFTLVIAMLLPAGVLSFALFQRLSNPEANVSAAADSLLLAGWVLSGVTLMGARRSILRSLDKRFFREQYDANRILTQLIESCRLAQTVEELANVVTVQIDRALHLDSAHFLMCYPGDLALRSPVSSVRQLPSTGALARLLESTREPLEVALERSSSVVQQLSLEEKEWIASAALRWLFPMVDSERRLIGCLAIGEKRSGLPLSRDDRTLISTVVESASLNLERRAGRARSLTTADSGGSDPEQPAHVCRRCGLVQSQGAACQGCGGDLDLAQVPLVFLGKFRIFQQVGLGGMGVVYRAYDLNLGRTVAIKTLPRASPAFAYRLRREAKAMAALDHPNLAVIHGAESWRGVPVLVMEYLHGGTLADRLKAGPIAADDALRIALVLTEALRRIHAAGILHGDIKPSNVGFTQDGVVKLLDFGLARVLGESNESAEDRLDSGSLPSSGSGSTSTASTRTVRIQRAGRQLVGTPVYMSPEALNGETDDSAFDIWSAVVLLFEALSGKHPFFRSQPSGTLQAIASGERPNTDLLPAHLPRTFTQFFDEALHPQKTRRPATAVELRDRLLGLSASLSTTSARSASGAA